MPTLTLDRLIALLRQHASQSGQSVHLLLIGGIAMLAYGHPSRATTDVDGELREGVRSLKEFLSGHGVPANLGQSLSRWSVVAMPPGYRDRATILIDEPGLRMTLLSPVDFIIAKLRRGTDEDLGDAAWIALRYHINVQTSAPRPTPPSQPRLKTRPCFSLSAQWIDSAKI